MRILKPKLNWTSLAPALVAACAMALPEAGAASSFTAGHGDIGLAYDAGSFDPHWHLHAGATVNGSPLGADTEFAPPDVAVLVPNPSINRPPGAQYDFLGISTGEPFWYLPQGLDVAKPFLGIASEELSPGDWSSLSMSLLSMVGPSGGEFSLWQTGLFGPEVKFATSDGINGADTMPMIPGSHDHYNYGFTEPGVYYLTFGWSGEHVTDGAISASATYAFGVIELPPSEVPEPAHVGAGAMAVLAGLYLRRRVARASLGERDRNDRTTRIMNMNTNMNLNIRTRGGAGRGGLRMLVAALAVAGWAATAGAQAFVYTLGHGDIGVSYTAGALVPHWHLSTGATVNGAALGVDTEYTAGQVLAYVPNPSVGRPAGAQWNFLGNNSGEPLWFLPQSQDAGKPFLGLSTEDLVPADWASLSLKVVSVSSPVGGQFSVWQTGLFGPEPKFATSDGITGADTMPLIPGSHDHYNVGFTATGVYQVTLQWNGVHNLDGAKSGTGTFSFGVTAVPEPGEITLGAGLALAGWLGVRRRWASARADGPVG